MRSQHIPMTWEEYKLLPFELGWKQEYWDGQLHLSPRHVSTLVKLTLKPHAVKASCLIRPVTADDCEQLIASYIRAFSDTIHFCDYPPEEIAEHAHRDIHLYFSGRRGHPLAASRVAVHPAGGEQIIGAALINAGHQDSPLLFLLFVPPEGQQQGIATAIVSDAINVLYASGERALYSQYHLGNEQSRRWHQRMGFIDEPDVIVFQLYYRRAERELWRREQLGALTEDERHRLTQERDHWKAQLDAIEAGRI
jgi:RimJ/RimL family protein N-acetyltransferase